jgi:hypothetical protein
VTSTIPMDGDPGFREGRRRWWTTRLDRTRGAQFTHVQGPSWKVKPLLLHV